jgi:hypothetical protein
MPRVLDDGSAAALLLSTGSELAGQPGVRLPGARPGARPRVPPGVPRRLNSTEYGSVKAPSDPLTP